MNESVEEQELNAENTEGKKGKGIILYILITLFSFITICAALYFVVIQPRLAENATNIQIVEPLPDSMNSNQEDLSAAAETDLQEDSLEYLEPVPGEGVLSLMDQFKVLQVESARRQKEIDYLWSEFLGFIENSKLDQNEELLNLSSPEALQAELAKMQEQLDSTRQQIALKEKEINKLKEERTQSESSSFEVATGATANKNSVVKIYASMKAQNAALILSQLNQNDVADILINMNQRQAAKILSAMSPSFAAKICKLMEQQKQT